MSDGFLKILIIEDSVDDYDLLVMQIKRAGYKLNSKRIESREELINSLDDHWDLIISDNSLPQFNAPEALKITRSTNYHLPFIIVSGTIGEEAAVSAMRAGANDYILKGNLSRLMPAIEREVRESDNKIKKIKIEKKLEQSEKMYRFLSGSIQDVFIALDADFNISYWNDHAQHEFNTGQGVLKTPIFNVLPAFKNEKLKSVLEHVLNEKKSQHFEFEHASYKYFEGSIYPTEEGITIIAKNVTEQKQVKENLLKINNELETLMYRISHDLKGPVASIKGLINIGMKDFHDNKEVQLLLKMFDNSTLMLNNTLNELLNITRIKQGQIKPDPFQLHTLLNDVVSGLKFSDGFDDVEIKLEGCEDIEILTDKRLFRSIIQNLLENAIKYRARDKNKKFIKIYASKQKNTTTLYIEDNGQGIPNTLQKNVFEMFYRANESSQGSGLGLYIVKSALDKLNGIVTLNSEEGTGSTFMIKIPDLNDLWG
ncbi:ATP-binding protein [Fulvivirga maritima]|uniref:hybrid sensor histidine kinase/response regulator n=1 Tax=Fulvivirga maritima TaxID=2904247 RepID=UPI001F48C855|nr:ATP-binding protein [Fulvivirga maritima]UII28235.1 ATP-binding protein [Fulvivirga maritima]